MSNIAITQEMSLQCLIAISFTWSVIVSIFVQNVDLPKAQAKLILRKNKKAIDKEFQKFKEQMDGEFQKHREELEKDREEFENIEEEINNQYEEIEQFKKELDELIKERKKLEEELRTIETKIDICYLMIYAINHHVPHGDVVEFFKLILRLRNEYFFYSMCGYPEQLPRRLELHSMIWNDSSRLIEMHGDQQ